MTKQSMLVFLSVMLISPLLITWAKVSWQEKTPKRQTGEIRSCGEPMMKIENKNRAPFDDKRTVSVPIDELTISRDKQYIAGHLYATSKLAVWDLRSGDQVDITLDGLTAQFSPQNDTLVLERKGEVLAYSAGQWQAKILFKRPEGSGLRELRFSPDGQFLAVVYETKVGAKREPRNYVAIYKASTGQKISEVAQMEPYNYITALAFSPDNRILATTALMEDVVRLWDVQTGRQIKAIKKGEGLMQLHDLIHPAATTDMLFFPGGKILAVMSQAETVKFWDVQTGKLTRTLEFGEATGRMRVTPDGRLLIAIGQNGFLVWDLQQNRRVCYEEGYFRAIALSPDGSILARVESPESSWNIAVYDVNKWHTQSR
jgi:WD40 repeat protein